MIRRMIEIRQDHDDSQRDLAKALGYHQTQIARYETGVNAPPVDYVIKFCKYSCRLPFRASASERLFSWFDRPFPLWYHSQKR